MKMPSEIDSLVQAAQQAFMAQLLQDSLKFGGAVMLRRIVGIAHIEDFQQISDPDIRCAASANVRESF